MSVARTLRLKKLIIANDYEHYRRIMGEKQWNPKEVKFISKPEDLLGFHFYPVQNCELYVLGNHPVMASDEFRQLLLEKNHDK